MSQVVIRHIEGVTLMGRAKSNHWVVMDGPETFGGAEAATKPMELLLLGLGGCTSMDTLSILRKMRENVFDYEMQLESERADEHPMVFTKIHLKYTFYGKNINADNVKKAIELSMVRYCAATAMLQKTAEITYDFEIKEME